jgi:hypothetical protein
VARPDGAGASRGAPEAREVEFEITQHGEVVDAATLRGPIRIRRAR